MDVSIIIINYNTELLLKQCLNSVFENTTGIEFEVIVVDNASKDGSLSMLSNTFLNVILIESDKNLGFGQANNLAAEQASGKYLFLLNSDTILLNNAVKVLFDFIETNPETGTCCGNLFDENKNPNHSYFIYLSPFIREISLLLGGLFEKLFYGKNAIFNYTAYPKKVNDPTAADLLIRTELFRSVRGFDPEFFMYGEDRYLNYKVKKTGYKTFNVPQAEIIHLDGKSTKLNVNRLLMIRQGTNIYYKKTQTLFMQFICRLLFFLMIYSRLNYFKILGNSEKCELWRVLLKNEKNL